MRIYTVSLFMIIASLCSAQFLRGFQNVDLCELAEITSVSSIEDVVCTKVTDAPGPEQVHERFLIVGVRSLAQFKQTFPLEAKIAINVEMLPEQGVLFGTKSAIAYRQLVGKRFALNINKHEQDGFFLSERLKSDQAVYRYQW